MSSPHLSQWSLLTHFPSFSKYFLSAAHAGNCAMNRNHTYKSLGARDNKETVAGQCDRLWWVQRWSGEGPVEAELWECCLVWVTPRQGHEGAQKPAIRATSRQREQHVQKLRDKWKGEDGAFGSCQDACSWSACVGSLCWFCFPRRFSGASLKEHSQPCLFVS